ncbi:MAG: Rne/Rng family ribonuclease [Pseudomonadota bacterium]
MSRKMLIDAAHPEETRVVVVEGSQVEDFDFESLNRKPLRGNIYLARVTRVEPSLQAAFVEYGGNRHGFLAFSEIHPDYYQIPVSDREALLAAEAEEAEAAAALAALTGADEDGPDDPDDDAGPDARDVEVAAEPIEDVERDEVAADDQSEETEAEGTDAGEAASAEAEGDEPATDELAEATSEAENDDESDDAGEVEAGEVEDGDPGSDEDGPKSIAARAPEPPSVSVPFEEDAQTDEAGAEREGPVEASDDASLEAAGEPDLAEASPEPAAADASSDASSDTAGDAGGDAGGDEIDASGSAETSDTPEDAQADEDQTEARDIESDEKDAQPISEPPVDPEAAARKRFEDARRTRNRLLRNYKIQEVIKRRQILLVQVVKEERGNKGAALTTYLSLAGRYCVLMPNTARGGGISRKITNGSDRRRLRSVVNDLEVPMGIGLIIRTAGAKRSKTEIKRDYEYLLRLWETIRDLTLKSIAPTLIYEEASLIKRCIRDLYDKDIETIQVEGEAGYREAKDFMRMLMPSHAKHVQPYKDRAPLFQRYGVESQLDTMYSPNVRLKSGGYLVINQTEALVAIDVNSGKATRERNIEATALRTNLEAAEAIARQCRLRDLASLLVIDFIDMEEPRNNRAVERRFKDHLKGDRARIQVGRISGFGLLEMSRQRRRSNLTEGTTRPCPTCSGAGVIRSVDSAAQRILRTLEDEAFKASAAIVTATTSEEVALHILNRQRDRLRRVEEMTGVTLEIEADRDLIGDAFEIDRRGPKPTVPQKDVEAVQPDLEWEADSEADVEERRDERPAEDDAEGGGRKRRRRRRRRRSDSEEPSDVENTASETVEEAAAESEDTDREQSEDENGQKPRRRRGRRGGRRNRRRKDGDEQTAAPALNGEAAGDESAAAPSETQEGEPVEIEIATPDAEAASEPVGVDEQAADDLQPAAVEAYEPEAEAEPASEPAPMPEVVSTPDPEPEPHPEPEPLVEQSPKPARKGWWQKALGRGG